MISLAKGDMAKDEELVAYHVLSFRVDFADDVDKSHDRSGSNPPPPPLAALAEKGQQKRGWDRCSRPVSRLWFCLFFLQLPSPIPASLIQLGVYDDRASRLVSCRTHGKQWWEWNTGNSPAAGYKRTASHT